MPLRIGPASDATSWVLSRREAALAAGRPRRCALPSSTQPWGPSQPGPPAGERWYAVRSLGASGAALALSPTEAALRDSVGPGALMSWHLRHDTDDHDREDR